MLQSVKGFNDYFEGIRRRTLHFIDAIPVDRIDWFPVEGEFTFGELIRYLAETEAMFIDAVVNGNREAMIKLGTLSDSALSDVRPSLYLTLINIKPPHIYGLGVEDVIALATG